VNLFKARSSKISSQVLGQRLQIFLLGSASSTAIEPRQPGNLFQFPEWLSIRKRCKPLRKLIWIKFTFLHFDLRDKDGLPNCSGYLVIEMIHKCFNPFKSIGPKNFPANNLPQFIRKSPVTSFKTMIFSPPLGIHPLKMKSRFP